MNKQRKREKERRKKQGRPIRDRSSAQSRLNQLIDLTLAYWSDIPV